MMRFGPDNGPVVVLALPLFEEANRTRAVAVAMLRALADAGVASALPDLPGQGESLVPTQNATLSDLRGAFEAAVASIVAEGRRAHVVAIRSGALLDLFAPVDSRWHLAPQEGQAVLRELMRIGQEVGRDRTADDAPVLIAGNLIAPDLITELAVTLPYDKPEPPRRVVRLDGDPRPADLHLAGAPPWRRSEPGNDDPLAQSLAADIAEWVRACDAR